MDTRKLWVLLLPITIIILYHSSRSCLLGTECELSPYLEYVYFPLIRPLYLFALITTPVVALLPFIRNNVLKTWRSFAIYAGLASLAIIVQTPAFPIGGGLFSVNYFDYINRDMVTKFTASIFTLVSLAIFFFGTFFSKKK